MIQPESPRIRISLTSISLRKPEERLKDGAAVLQATSEWLCITSDVHISLLFLNSLLFIKSTSQFHQSGVKQPFKGTVRHRDVTTGVVVLPWFVSGLYLILCFPMKASPLHTPTLKPISHPHHNKHQLLPSAYHPCPPFSFRDSSSAKHDTPAHLLLLLLNLLVPVSASSLWPGKVSVTSPPTPFPGVEFFF